MAVVEAGDVADIVASWTGIPVSQLSQDDCWKLLNLASDLKVGPAPVTKQLPACPYHEVTIFPWFANGRYGSILGRTGGRRWQLSQDECWKLLNLASDHATFRTVVNKVLYKISSLQWFIHVILPLHKSNVEKPSLFQV